MTDALQNENSELITPDFDAAAEVLRSYKDKYKGQQCIVVGNGPNLNVYDLDRVREKGIFTIASNMIYKAFDRTDWRPSIYTSMAPGVVRRCVPEVEALKCELKLFAVRPKGKMYPAEGALPLKLFDNNMWIVERGKPEFSEDIAECVYGGQTITYINLQIAAYLGFTNIVLFGVKHLYRKQWRISPQIAANPDAYKNVQGTIPGVFINTNGIFNDHFYGNIDSVEPGERQDSEYYCVDEATRAFERAREYAEGHGIKICNASGGSMLKVFERIAPDKVLTGECVDDLLFDPDWAHADEVLRSYKNKYKGERCFIIGNGPSLCAEDLDKIKGEYSFAANRIYLIFDETEWRPTFLTLMDKPYSLEYLRELNAVPVEMKFSTINRNAKMYPLDGAIPVRIEHNAGYWIQKGSLPPFSNDAVKCVHSGMTSTYISLQLAVYMGFKEIVLLGVDHQYKYQWSISQNIRQNPEKYFDKTLRGESREMTEVKSDHFGTKYNKGRSIDVGGVYCTQEVTLAYLAARNYAKEHHIRIINATRGGKLEVFQRMSLEKVLAPKPEQLKDNTGKTPPDKKKKQHSR
ncbi:MAG: DUF115 domain-containing protein [Fretibacterium sp.]|nr:DUF115 domain-containing protein [Fretibacterium sp.]